MTTDGEHLDRLQHLDSEEDIGQRRLAEVKAGLRDREALKRARLALESARALAQNRNTQQQDLDLKLQGLTEKISSSERRLYGGTVKNTKELTDLQAELESLGRRQRKLEDKLLEAMIERDEAEALRTQAQEHFDETTARWSTRQADLTIKQNLLREQLAEIEQARKKLLPNIDAGDLAVYTSLRRRKGGIAVMQINGNSCGACGVTISPNLKWQLREGKLVRCSNCERIIVRT